MKTWQKRATLRRRQSDQPPGKKNDQEIGRDVEREQEQKTKRAQKRSSADEVLAFLQRSCCCCRYRWLVPEPSKNQGMRYRIIHPSTIFRSLRGSTKFAHDKVFSFITCEEIHEKDEVFVQKPAKNPRRRRAFRPKPAAQ
jgi:CRISPR/Cas system CSM-associated protein Csm3 (group 7 of RAMP superfamily)